MEQHHKDWSDRLLEAISNFAKCNEDHIGFKNYGAKDSTRETP